jgi:hypothetical protein
MAMDLRALPNPLDPVVKAFGKYNPTNDGYDFNKDPSANFAMRGPSFIDSSKEKFADDSGRHPGYNKRQKLTLGQIASQKVIAYDAGGQGESDSLGFFPLLKDDGSQYGISTKFSNGTMLFRTSQRGLDGHVFQHKYNSLIGMNKLLRAEKNLVDLTKYDAGAELLSPFDRPMERNSKTIGVHNLQHQHLTVAGVIHDGRGAYNNNYIGAHQPKMYHYQVALASKVLTHNVFSFGKVPPAWNGARLWYIQALLPTNIRDTDLSRLTYTSDRNHRSNIRESKEIVKLYDIEKSALHSDKAKWQLVPFITADNRPPLNLTTGTIMRKDKVEMTWHGSCINVGRFTKVSEPSLLSTSGTRRYQTFNILAGQDESVQNGSFSAGLSDEEGDRIPKIEMLLTPGSRWESLR